MKSRFQPLKVPLRQRLPLTAGSLGGEQGLLVPGGPQSACGCLFLAPSVVSAVCRAGRVLIRCQ